MIQIKDFMKRSVITLTAFMLVGILPVPVFADTAAADTVNGTTQPTGSAAGTYHYNDATGLWENDYYTWNPTTKETTPKQPLEYTYNPATGMWDTTYWQFNAAKNAYEQTPLSVATPPTGAITHGGPVAAPATAPSSAVTSDPVPTTAQATPQQSTADPATVGVPTQNNVSGQNTNNQNLNFNTSGTITNSLTSNASTGNALLLGNTQGGDATSGNALAQANIINMLQSSSGFNAPGVATFTANIQGNVTGDLVIDPTNFAQPANVSQQSLNNLKINDTTNGTINNDVNLTATSGNADVLKNTEAGNATTGTAAAVANVVNMINSIVAANQSFIGNVNIYGNYTGNILVPTDSLNALLASTGPSSTNATTTNNTVNSDLNVNNNTAINNNTKLAATSGTATVASNTQAGNASTGNALTNLTVLNLTNHQITAANSLLVFVNVLGKWVGVILDAPAGTTAAALGGGVTQNTTNAVNADANITNNETINNNLNLAATSGNATVAKNTQAGNATTGNASASANIVNLTGSQLNLSSWFGILFINVFGTWNGNFGTKKPVVAPVGGMGGGANNPIEDMRVFQFVPTSGHTSASRGGYGLAPYTGGTTSSDQTGGSDTSATAVAAAQVSKVLADGIQKAAPKHDDSAASRSPFLPIPIILGLAGLTFVATDRFRNRSKMTA